MEVRLEGQGVMNCLLWSNPSKLDHSIICFGVARNVFPSPGIHASIQTEVSELPVELVKPHKFDAILLLDIGVPNLLTPWLLDDPLFGQRHGGGSIIMALARIGHHDAKSLSGYNTLPDTSKVALHQASIRVPTSWTTSWTIVFMVLTQTQHEKNRLSRHQAHLRHNWLMQCYMKNLDACCHHCTILGLLGTQTFLSCKWRRPGKRDRQKTTKPQGFKARVAQGIHCNLAPTSMVLLRFVKVVHGFQTPWFMSRQLRQCKARQWFCRAKARSQKCLLIQVLHKYTPLDRKWTQVHHISPNRTKCCWHEEIYPWKQVKCEI